MIAAGAFISPLSLLHCPQPRASHPCPAVYSTGVLQFTPTVAVAFGVGVFAGINGWYYTLLFLMQRFRKRASLGP